METKHTPGEWKVKEDKFSQLFIDADEKTVSKIYVSKIKREEAKYNAMIISAAPEMQFALIEVRKKLIYMGWTADNYDIMLVDEALNKSGYNIK